jgi:hypothetical protein
MLVVEGIATQAEKPVAFYLALKLSDGRNERLRIQEFSV